MKLKSVEFAVEWVLRTSGADATSDSDRESPGTCSRLDDDLAWCELQEACDDREVERVDDLCSVHQWSCLPQFWCHLEQLHVSHSSVA